MTILLDLLLIDIFGMESRGQQCRTWYETDFRIFHVIPQFRWGIHKINEYDTTSTILIEEYQKD